MPAPRAWRIVSQRWSMISPSAPSPCNRRACKIEGRGGGVMAWGKNKGGGGGGCVAWLALLVALAALFVAWSAWRRTGGTFGQLTEKAKSFDGSFTVGDSDWKGAL